MKLLLILITAAAVIIAACVPQTEPQPQGNKTETVECVADSDCGVGGCSRQVCTTASEAEDLITTCEYRAEYGCLKLTSCGCVDGKCGWDETAEYKGCLDKLNSQEGQ